MSIASVMPTSHLIIWCYPLLLSSIFPSIRAFSSESVVCIRWPKYWSFSFKISPSNGHSGKISLKIDWFYLHAVQGICDIYIVSKTHMTLETPWTHQVPLSMGFPRQHYWSVLPFPSPGDLSSQPRDQICGPDVEAEAPVFWSSDVNNWPTGKGPDAGKDWGQKEQIASDDEMAGWHYWFNGHELGQTSGDGEGQGGLACCSPWSCKESDMTGWLNNNNVLYVYIICRNKINQGGERSICWKV